jgi:hypothetical protein
MFRRLRRHVTGNVLLHQPVGQCLSQLHRPILSLREGDQARLLLLSEHPLEGLRRALHPLLTHPLAFQRRHGFVPCHPWLLSNPRQPPPAIIILTNPHAEADMHPLRPVSGGTGL